MVTSVTAVLRRFKTAWATPWPPEAIIGACEEGGYTFWRDRILTPVTTIQLFLLQILHGTLRAPICRTCRASVQCVSLLSSPRETPPRPLWTPVDTPLRLRAAPCVRCRAVARASHLFGRWLGLLHARYPCPSGGLWSVDGATAGVRLSRGTHSGAVPRRHGPAPEAGGRTPLDPRSCPGAQVHPA